MITAPARIIEQWIRPMEPVWRVIFMLHFNFGTFMYQDTLSALEEEGGHHQGLRPYH